MTEADPSSFCAVCGAKATAWSANLLIIQNLRTMEDEVVVLSKGAWCAEHDQPGSVQHTTCGFEMPLFESLDSEEGDEDDYDFWHEDDESDLV